MQEVFDKIEASLGEVKGSDARFAAAQKYLEEVEGKDYRLEQAAAKLVEYFKLEMEVENRRGELESILPGMGEKLAANDSHFHQDGEKYLVH